MFDPKAKEKLIYEMCCCMNSGYDLEFITKTVIYHCYGEYEEHEIVIQGMSPHEKLILYNKMKYIFENCIEKYFKLEIN